MLKRSDFVACYDNSKKYHTPNFIVFVRKKNIAEGLWRVGFAVSKKIGCAVLRNRVKRVLREVFRLNQELLPVKTDIVVVPKKHIQAKNIDFASTESELITVFKRIGQ